MGPRHMVLSKDGKYIYLLGELDSHIEILSLENGCDKPFIIDRVKILPEAYEGENSAAAIKRSNDGKFLYASNRGHYSISIFSIKEDGNIEIVDNYLTSGRVPRDFSITEDDKLIIIGFQDSEFISILERDLENGRINISSEKRIELSEIVCTPRGTGHGDRRLRLAVCHRHGLALARIRMRPSRASTKTHYLAPVGVRQRAPAVRR